MNLEYWTVGLWKIPESKLAIVTPHSWHVKRWKKLACEACIFNWAKRSMNSLPLALTGVTPFDEFHVHKLSDGASWKIDRVGTGMRIDSGDSGDDFRWIKYSHAIAFTDIRPVTLNNRNTENRYINCEDVKLANEAIVDILMKMSTTCINLRVSYLRPDLIVVSTESFSNTLKDQFRIQSLEAFKQKRFDSRNVYAITLTIDYKFKLAINRRDNQYQLIPSMNRQAGGWKLITMIHRLLLFDSQIELESTVKRMWREGEWLRTWSSFHHHRPSFGRAKRLI